MTTSPEALREAVERLTRAANSFAQHIDRDGIGWIRVQQNDVFTALGAIEAQASALQEARADADLCASSWTKEIEARNATASIARRFHAALQEIASGEVGPEQEGHYLAHRRAVKTARKAIGALSPGGARDE